MITFKQFLEEDSESDAIRALAKKELDSKEKPEQDHDHDSYEEAALEFIKHCSQFPDINKPLYRISGESWFDRVTHYLKTRVPRTRRSESRGGSAEQQNYLFSQPEWADYPKRRQSIFCSTRKEFDVGTVDDDAANLLMIFPFDGVKIAMLDDKDLNTMNILKGTSWGEDGTQIDEIGRLIRDAGAVFTHTSKEDQIHSWHDIPELLKKTYLENGVFDVTAKGDEEMADAFRALSSSDRKTTLFVTKNIPNNLSPEKLGAKLVTSAGLDLPGNTRECWFSGKYLSVPARDYNDFKAEVLKLQKRKQ